MLFTGSQRVRHDLAIEQQQQKAEKYLCISAVKYKKEKLELTYHGLSVGGKVGRALFFKCSTSIWTIEI